MPDLVAGLHHHASRTSRRKRENGSGDNPEVPDIVIGRWVVTID